MNYNEVKQHGTIDFPFELYKLYDPSQPRYEMSMHWHSSIEIIRVLSGELYVTLDNRRYVGRSGDVFFVNSETAHSALPKDCTYECVVFNLAFLKTGNPECDAFVDNIIHKNLAVNEQITDREVKEIIYEFFMYMNLFSEGDKFRVFSTVQWLLAEILDKKLYRGTVGKIADKSEQNVLKLKRTISYIRENYDKEITISDMAKVTGLSTKYFCAFFKQMTEKTPIEYLNMYRVERAARKLLGTDMSVTDIAYSTGFNDLSYFIKTFKSLKKCTPKVYRKI
ncbi:MAG: AraC family transcriptional regulator [Clostridia bacterium]|nr:AraC family transcriptional regulator [Clostridia bacterium]